MEKINESRNKKCWPLWATIVIIFLLLLGMIFWTQYERTQFAEKQKENLKEMKAIVLAKSNNLCECCECPKPKAKVSHKKAKPKTKQSKPKPQPSANKIAIVSETLRSCDSLGGVLLLRDGKIICDIKKEITLIPPPTETRDFYENALMPRTWVTEPEKEVAKVEPPKVGRKIIVIREQAPYYGGYSSGYSYAPQVTYGQQYIPPQTVFVPAPQVIVPAPSVVTPPPGGYIPRGYTGGVGPQGNTGGRSPSGTTGPAL